MAFDWVAFLDQQRIEYKREGQRELRIRCPWCLTEGKVLAINVQGGRLALLA